MKALIRYIVPELSVGPDERALYSFAPAKEVKEVQQELHDARISPDIVNGPAGLDVQGFTYLCRPSSLTSDELLAGRNVEDVYLKEVTDLICEVTGAERAVVDGVAFRQKPVGPKTHDLYYYEKAETEFDKAVSTIPRDAVRVPGREKSTAAEPARIAHIDYTVQGLKNIARWGRPDIRAVAANALQAEDAIARGENRKAPRYAAFSVWRPLEVVKRDPLAVLDWRSLDETELVPYSSRVLSGVTENGETLRESANLIPPAKPEAQKWYYMSEQSPDDVVILKFADTRARAENVAGMCGHCSPYIAGTEHEPTRRSVECRVFAFWD